jgi:hypothetical protein
VSGRPIPYKLLLTMAEQATGFVWEVPGNPVVTIAVQPFRLGVGPWALFRRGFDHNTVWDGTAWVDANRPIEAIYRWTLAEALLRVDDRIANEAIRHAAWQTDRAERQPSEDEFLAEFASEVPA